MCLFETGLGQVVKLRPRPLAQVPLKESEWEAFALEAFDPSPPPAGTTILSDFAPDSPRLKSETGLGQTFKPRPQAPPKRPP
jgi:hypothetical protein